jgi:GT2 family glycosyltransferase
VSFEIILVDNSSTDVDPDKFLILFPQIILIKNTTNFGFSKGNNIGIKHSSGKYVILANSDTYLKEDSISKLVTQFISLSNIAVLGPRMTYPDGRIQNTARKFRSINWELLDLFRIVPLLMPYKKRAKLMLGKYFKANFNCECDWLNGAFFMFKKSILNELPDGQLDDRFFMYGEDHLWCYQFKKLGYKNYFFYETTIIHINNASTNFDKRIDLLKIMLRHELLIMKERKGSGLYYLLFKVVYCLKEESRILLKKIYYSLDYKLN